MDFAKRILAEIVGSQTTMNSTPKFTILLPTKARPDLLCDSLISILGQTFQDFEVVVSNNGADAASLSAIRRFLSDQRVRYVEHENVLSMPAHWEKISKLARGQYLIVVTDRSVLKKDALATISDIHDRGGADAQIVSWSWDLYFDDASLLQRFADGNPIPQRLDSDFVAVNSLNNGRPFPAALPRGLNSSVHMSVVEKIREIRGEVFSPISPDFSFAYACLMVQPVFIHLDSALFVSQGLRQSNGGSSYQGDTNGYLSTLGLATPHKYAPVKEALVENVIFEDFLAACHDFNRPDLVEKLDWLVYYSRCIAELQVKRTAGTLSAARIEEIGSAIRVALNGEQDALRKNVNLLDALKSRHTLRSNVRRFVVPLKDRLRPLYIRFRGGQKFQSALEAAGHIRL